MLSGITMTYSNLRNAAKQLKNQGKSYAEIGTILEMPRYAAKNLISYKCKAKKMKPGQKKKINKSAAISIKREISRLTNNGE